MNIQNLTDDVLCAYLDDELSPQARAQLERQLPGEPGARVRLDRFRESDERLRKAFALPADAASDPLLRLLIAERPSAEVVPLRTRLRRYAAPIGLALAATVAGLAIGLGWRGGVGAPDDAVPGAAPRLSAALQGALDRNASGELRRGVMVLFTFRRNDGTPCRQFEIADAGRVTEGVACRGASEGWQLVAWEETAREDGGYRTAGAGESAVDDAVEQIDASGALSSAEEAELIAKGW